MQTILSAAGVALLCLLGCYIIMVLIMRGGVRTTKKTTWMGMPAPLRLLPCILFNDVWLKRMIRGYSRATVILYLKRPGSGQIQVKFDPMIDGTPITVKPALFMRIFPPLGSCTAKSITIWVSNYKDTSSWEKWVRESEAAYFNYKQELKTMPAPKTIHPR